ncbi:putative diacylglycerol kinase [Candidatus Filomicrobium marinum]|uniref:Putative diacylglycerol kinase n=1 Tax=Candidatus Filomicrobium marinum TaxID=1608628 RepID=A0A0D6JC94_9HYPH|nr:diacylglycerol kinase family protein [Candidatus Filomicrobium marinum]CFX04817.1 putative diacylglycerol kinase [Candidatus Filomicrobium marinum]CPR16130.1 putative diacylglycerol kinase [Candidatus Filomicrobium marinum]
MLINLFHNPTAGAGSEPKEVIDALRLAGFEPRYCSTKNIPAFKQMLKEPADIAVIAGGDGTVSKVLKHLPSRNAFIGIIPLGTANNIARSLGIHGPPWEVAETWNTQCWRWLDVGVVDGPWGCNRFIEDFGIGPSAQMLRKDSGSDTNGATRLMKGRKTLSGLIQKARPFKLKGRVDKFDLPTSVIALEILNIGYNGPGLPLLRAASPSDGFLDVVAVLPEQRKQAAQWIQLPRDKAAPVVNWKGHSIEILLCEDVGVRVDDDEICGLDESGRLTASLESEAFKVLVARSALETPQPETDRVPESAD